MQKSQFAVVWHSEVWQHSLSVGFPGGLQVQGFFYAGREGPVPTRLPCRGGGVYGTSCNIEEQNWSLPMHVNTIAIHDRHINLLLHGLTQNIQTFSADMII